MVQRHGGIVAQGLIGWEWNSLSGLRYPSRTGVCRLTKASTRCVKAY